MLAFLHPTLQLVAAEKEICALFWKFIPSLHDTVLGIGPALAWQPSQWFMMSK